MCFNKIFYGRLYIFYVFTGFFTVNATSDSNMYFWFFPSQASIHIYKYIVTFTMRMYGLIIPFQSKNTSAPLLLWLQGGPGGSSLFGLFIENGPLSVTKDGEGM